MSNPLYGMMQNQQPNSMVQRFQQFQQMFRGDPKQKVQELLNSGRVSQSQYDAAVRMAQQFQRMFGVN